MTISKPRDKMAPSSPARQAKTKYGKGQKATFKPGADTTEEQEYKSGGLPETTKYSVDKNGVK